MISQESYIDKIVIECGQEHAKISKYPMDSGYFKQKGTLLESNEESIFLLECCYI